MFRQIIQFLCFANICNHSYLEKKDGSKQYNNCYLFYNNFDKLWHGWTFNLPLTHQTLELGHISNVHDRNIWKLNANINIP